MNRLRTTGKQLCIAILCLGILACASKPEVDHRPEVMLSAEKSLELGVSNYLENNFGKAESHFNQALFIYRNIDNPEGITSSCLNLAKTKLSLGQIENARAYASVAHTIIQREQLTGYNELLTLILSSINIEEENYPAAIQHIDVLLQRSGNLINHAIRTAALKNRTRIAFITGADDVTDWAALYREALNQPGQNTPLNQARLLRFEAALEPDKSAAKLGNALTFYRESAHSPGIAATLTEWAGYDLSAGEFAQGIEKLQRALFIRASQHDRKNSREILQLLATSYKRLDNSDKSVHADHWLQQLDDPSFTQWNTIIAEFGGYPR